MVVAFKTQTVLLDYDVHKLAQPYVQGTRALGLIRRTYIANTTQCRLDIPLTYGLRLPLQDSEERLTQVDAGWKIRLAKAKHYFTESGCQVVPVKFAGIIRGIYLVLAAINLQRITTIPMI